MGREVSDVPAAALAFIKRFEGCSLTAYRCPAGRLTIGWGRTCGVREGDTCTQAQADAWLAEDVALFADGVRKLVKVPVTEGQFGALVSFAYNVGLSALANSTLIRKVNAGNFDGARDEFGRWVNAGGKRLDGLVRRRAAEAEMFGSDTTAGAD